MEIAPLCWPDVLSRWSLDHIPEGTGDGDIAETALRQRLHRGSPIRDHTQPGLGHSIPESMDMCGHIEYRGRLLQLDVSAVQAPVQE